MDARISQAWHSAWLMRTKTLPKLKTLLGEGPARTAEAMSPERQWQIMAPLSASKK